LGLLPDDLQAVGGYGMLLAQAKKTKMLKNILSLNKIFFATIILVFAGFAPTASADSYQDQINQLNAQDNLTQAQIDALSNQASSYQAEINQLQGQVSGLQNAIALNQAKQTQIQQQIQENKAKVAQEKQTLADVIRTMYVSGQVSTVEMLASSKNISDFVNAETYRSVVSNEIQDLLSQIASLQAQLKQQNAQLNIVLNTENQQSSQLQSTEAQQQQLLSYNQAQQASYNQQIQNNQAEITTLQAEQLAANRTLLDNGGVIDASGTCGVSGDTYPATATGPDGNWGCSYPLDNAIDNWGMYNRECVSYTAWMVYSTYGYMPYWGGNGNANQWPADAEAAGIPVGSTPKINSVAIFMGGSSDPYGHAMWVVGINGDMITVKQYNLYYDGNYYETTINDTGLTYIYFGG
jgi:peptidoglycan DL-endopeptidase CwlO